MNSAEFFAMAIEFKEISFDDERLASYSKLLKSVFGDEKKFDVEALKWRYKDNPDGEAVGFDAFDGERLIAHYVATPMKAVIQGEVQRGLLSLNTAVDAEYRGKNLFPVVSKSTYELAKNLGFDFVIGVANGNSTKIFIKRLGFQLVAPLKTGFFFFLKWKYTQADFEPIADENWLTWRIANPAQQYFVREKKMGLLISTSTHIPFIHCFSFFKKLHVQEKVNFLPKIYMYMGLNNSFNFNSLNFIPIPERFKPSPLNLIYRSLSGKVPVLSDSVNFSFLDFDPY